MIFVPTENGTFMANFELFRFSLFERDQRDMFVDNKEDREQFLRSIFSGSIEFEHRGQAFHFVPLENEESEVIGQIGRGVLVQENKPPEEKFEEIVHEAWMASPIIIDPTYHEDGQKIAMQYRSQVGSTASILKSLVAQINTLRSNGKYFVDISRLLDESSFWRFASQNKGNITRLSFEFSAPNMFGSSDDFSDDLRNLRDKEHVKKVRVQWANPDGLETDTDTTRQAVDYAQKGGGSISAATKGGKGYSSNSQGEKTKIENDQIDRSNLAESLIKLSKRILGRE